MNQIHSYIIRNTRVEDFATIIEISSSIYNRRAVWTMRELNSHLQVFPEGQIVAVEEISQKVVGFASSLIITWDDYHFKDNWEDFTENGMFTNHDPENGYTLYGADVAVSPDFQKKGVGNLLYQARKELAEGLGLRRIRAGARLSGYHRYAALMSAKEYVDRVIKAELNDPTLTFQLNYGFQVIAVVGGYFPEDLESLGYAALIEYII